MLVACPMLVIAFVLGLSRIVTRVVLEQPAEWSEILIRRSPIWLVFMGIPTAFGKVRWSASICCTAEARPGCGAFSTGSSAWLHRR